MICVVLIFNYGWLKHSEELEHFLSLAKNDYLIQTLRRKPLSLEKGERIYNFWKINSQISVHWRNVYHLAKITEKNLT